MGYELASPVNTALVIALLYVLRKIFVPSLESPDKIPTDYKDGYNWLPAEYPPTVVFRTYTPKTLSPFNGKDHDRILLAIKGTVFDVSAGRNFYGPGDSIPVSDGFESSRLSFRWTLWQLCWKRCFEGHGQTIL